MAKMQRYCFYRNENGRRVLRVVWYKGHATQEILIRLEHKPLEWFNKK